MKLGGWWLAAACALVGVAQAQEDEHGHPEGRENARIAVPARVPISTHATVGTSVQLLMNDARHPHPHMTYVAFLGETEETWFLEYVDPALGELRHVNPILRDTLLALEVRKSDGWVLRAWSGCPGQAGLTHHVVEPPPAAEPTSQPTSQPASRPTSQPTSQPASRPTSQPAPAQPAGKVQTFTVKAGTFEAREAVQGGLTWWLGTTGPTRGALIKTVQSELVKLGEPESFDLGSRTIEVVRLDYSDRSTVWVTDDPLVADFVPLFDSGRGVARVRGLGFETRVERVETDARPLLVWPEGVLPPR